MNEEIKIKFEVKKIIYRNSQNGYTIASVKIKEHPKTIKIPTAEPIVTGYFPTIHIKDEFKSNGRWIDTGANGYQFNVSVSTLIFPETNKGMIDFLTKNAKGVGRITAKKIVEKFKEDTLNIIKNNPEELLKIKGITKKKAKNIQKEVLKHKEYEDIAVFLMSLGFNHTQTSKIYERYNTHTIHIINENIYRLCNTLEFSFRKIDEVAKKLNIKADDDRRVEQAILELIKYNLNNRGNLFIYKDDIFKDLSNFLNKYNSFVEKVVISENKINKALNKLTMISKIKIEDDRVYLKFYLDIENKIVEMLLNIISSSNSNIYSKNNINNLIKKHELKSGIRLADKQKEAVHIALENKLSIISGGPGTGKSQTINTIISCIKQVKADATIELCAPTGKAAKRMTEITNIEAKTIHRTIGLNSLDEHTQLKDIDVDFLIIDEASMIDAYVFYCLLTCISAKTQIVIVGDYEQLPSVGAGLILRDLINSKVIKTTILSEIFRQAKDSQIIVNSHKIIKGNKNISLNHDKKDFYFIKTANKIQIREKIIEKIQELLNKGFKLDDIQILSVMNKGDLGVIELNREIQERFNKEEDNKNEVRISEMRTLRLNDKVMQTENNYDLNVFNGEVGKIIKIELIDKKRLELVVDFNDKIITYSNNTVTQLTLAYAITVHKSQGSEFDIVIMPFHSSLNILLNRNIIYTGWTRAKKKVICIGDIDELNKGIDKTDNTIRNSMIKEKLINKLEIKKCMF